YWISGRDATALLRSRPLAFAQRDGKEFAAESRPVALGRHMMEISTYAARAAAQLGRTVNLALDDVALTPAGYRMLAYLATGETAAKVLAAKLAISRPTVTATLDWLEPQGYVTRSPSELDRRRVDI